jgi:hypothetical protein
MSSGSKTAGRIAIPRFESQQAEAEWFDRHRKPLFVDMRRRLKAGEGKTLAEALAQSVAKENVRLKP